MSHESVLRISTILNRGITSEDDTSIFKHIKHDALVSDLADYLESNKHLIGNIQIECSQALNDRGVDLILIVNNDCKIGFQIKSHYDVTEKNFAANVKRQYTESLSHGLKKWYLLICSPIREGKKSFRSKISHLINELSVLKLDYHCIFGPQHTAAWYQNRDSVFSEEEFNLAFGRYTYNQSTNDQILAEIRKISNQTPKITINSPVSYSDMIIRDEPKAVETCSRINEVLEWKCTNEELKSTITDLNELKDALAAIPRRSRDFLKTVLPDCKDAGYGDLRILVQRITSKLGISDQELKDQIDILEEEGLAYIDENSTGRYDVIFSPVKIGWDAFNSIIEFCKKTNTPTEKILIELDFSLLD